MKMYKLLIAILLMSSAKNLANTMEKPVPIAKDGINFMLQYMRNHADDFPVLNIIFEYKYSALLNRADIFVNNILHEFKSWTPGTTWWNDFFSGTGNSYNQFNAYLSHIDNLNQLKYIFDAKKLGNTNVKTKFKELFIAKAEDIYNANPTLFNQFDRIGGGKIRNLQEFETLLNHSTFTINHPIFDFIKVE